ncbi:MAG: DUF3144 domain-containing protein [Asticcacaulis sp.]
MPITPDNQFNNRADAHINLSNNQASLFGPLPATEAAIYAAARFTGWYITIEAKTIKEAEAKSAAQIDYFTKLYRELLEENLQEQIELLKKQK